MFFRKTHISFLWVLPFSLALLLGLPTVLKAETMSSSNFQVQNGTFGNGGIVDSSSENFSQQSVIGETILGSDTSSANFQFESGFQELLGITVPTPDPDPVTSSGGGGGGGVAGLFGTVTLAPPPPDTGGDITPPTAPTETDTGSGIPVDAGSGLPAQLFDITLTLDDAVIGDISQLSSILTFDSFGTEPTPVDVSFIILDQAGNEVYRDDGSDVDIIVETQGFLRASFDELELPPGRYTLIAETLYNTDVRDTFRQTFEIREEQSFPFVLYWSIVLLIFLICIIFFIILAKRRKKEELAEQADGFSEPPHSTFP